MNKISDPGLILTGDRIFLRKLTLADCTEKYLSWLNDPEVNRFTQRAGRNFTREDMTQYVKEKNASPSDLLLGIFWKENGDHVGNILLSEIDFEHRYAEHSRLLGDTAYWGKRVGVEASRVLIHYAFSELGMHKILAGHLGSNHRAMASNRHLGFRLEGILRDQVWLDGRFVDVWRFGLLRDEFYASFPELLETQGRRLELG
ncbi:MAG: GNAT family N-acetyltransferase [Candidatus Binatia bacterium]